MTRITLEVDDNDASDYPDCVTEQSMSDKMLNVDADEAKAFALRTGGVKITTPEQKFKIPDAEIVSVV